MTAFITVLVISSTAMLDRLPPKNRVPVCVASKRIENSRYVLINDDGFRDFMCSKPISIIKANETNNPKTAAGNKAIVRNGASVQSVSTAL